MSFFWKKNKPKKHSSMKIEEPSPEDEKNAKLVPTSILYFDYFTERHIEHPHFFPKTF
jgi:hypothetical protein